MRKSASAIVLAVTASSLLSGSLNCAIAATGECQGQRDQLALRVSAGERAASRSDWKTARREFLEATKLDPKCAVAFYDLGVAQAHLGQLSDAVVSEQKAVEIDAKFSDAYVELGWILSQLQRYDEAVQAEKTALQINPSNRAASKNLDAIASARRGGDIGAMPAPAQMKSSGERSIASSMPGVAMTEARATAPARSMGARSQVQNLITAGQTAFKRQCFDLARQNFEQALAVQPDNAVAHADLGVVLGSLGNLDGQINEEKKAASLDPKNAFTWVNLGWALGKKQRWSDALSAYQKALTLAPNLVPAQIGQGLALFYTGKQEAGVAAVRIAKTNSPRNADAYVALGTMLAQQGRSQQAEVELREAMRLAPANREAKEQLARLMLESDKSEQAVKMFQELVSHDPSSALAHAGLSLALELKGDSNGAETEAKKALDLNPKLQIAQVTLDRISQKKPH